MAFSISGSNGPLFPIQVVHPKAAKQNPSSSRYGISPASLRYRITTFDPGARDVFTKGGTFNPFLTAFFANSPAPIKTKGLDVFVHEVMAATTTLPFPMDTVFPSRFTEHILPSMDRNPLISSFKLRRSILS